MTDAASLINESGRGNALIAELSRLDGVQCPGCDTPVDGRQALMSIVLGFKDAPRCVSCLATGLHENPEALRASLFRHIASRRCYTEAWNWASRRGGLPEIEMDSRDDEKLPDGAQGAVAVADSWDAGDQGCGELALALRLRLEKLKSGEVFHLTARDLGVPEDLPAWCRLTGHKLLRAAPPEYWIERKA